MSNLANSFYNLLASHEDQQDLDQVSTEDLPDIDDALDTMVESLEEDSYQLDVIDAEIERLEGMAEDSVSVEDVVEGFSPAMGELLEELPEDESFSLEAFGMEESVGGISDALNRMWQVYFLDFLTKFDWIADLVKNSSKRVNKYRDRIDQSRRKFSRKKPNLDQEIQTASYVQMHNYWMNEDGFILKPFAQLDEEEKVANYILFDYPSTIEGEMKDLASVAKRADFADADTFEKSVIKKLDRKQHPVELFDSNLLGGRPFMLHTGLRLTGKKKSDKDLLDRLGARRKVKVSKRLLVTTTSGLIPHVIPDVKMSVDEIDQLLNRGDDFLEMTEKYLKQTDQMQRQIGSLKNDLEKMVDGAKKDGGKGIQKDVRAIGRYAKSLVDCYWTPGVRISKRNIDIAKGINYLSNRLVAYAK